jgi:polar amino acid transport system permease protein
MSAAISADDQRVDFVAMAGRPVQRRRRPGLTVAVALLSLVFIWAAVTLVINPGFNWPVVGRYLFDARILAGLVVTLKLTLVAEIIGIGGGLLLAVMRMSSSQVLVGTAALYIWFFRGTPLLVQLLFWGFAAAIFPEIGIGIPFGGPMLASWDTNTAISLMTAAVLGLGLNEAAYTAEVVRAGLLSVPKGQTEASRAMGFSRLQTLRHVVLPQAMKVMIPPIGNNVNAMLKTTSLVVVIGVGDLLYSTQQIYAKNLQQIPLLIVVSIWYLAATSLLGFAQSRLERRFSREAATILTTTEAR